MTPDDQAIPIKVEGQSFRFPNLGELSFTFHHVYGTFHHVYGLYINIDVIANRMLDFY